MTVKARTAMALVLGLAWACDYTPDPAPMPSPSTTTAGGVVVVVPVATPIPVPSPGTVPTPRPVPGSPGTFTIVLATPPANSTITVADSFVAEVHRPTLDFEFRYPQNLTLDDDFTNIEITLVGGTGFTTSECLWTDLTHSIRLDRDDKAYLANSVALFRTGVWRRMLGANCDRTAPSSFTTSQVLFKLTPDVSQPTVYGTTVPMEWTFLVR